MKLSAPLGWEAPTATNQPPYSNPDLSYRIRGRQGFVQAAYFSYDFFLTLITYFSDY